MSAIGIQVLESIGMLNNTHEGSQEIRIQRHESREEAIDENELFTKSRDDVQAELKIDDVEHIDFIGMDRFDVNPNFQLIDFFNRLQRIALQHGLNFEEFCFARKSKYRKYSKYLFTWQGRTEIFQVEF